MQLLICKHTPGCRFRAIFVTIENVIIACDFLFKDVDECISPLDNECEQLCENTMGSYVCSCRKGYNQVGKTKCTGKHAFVVVLILNKTEL